jgi:DNA-binding transcriptional LysR family regulator
MEYQNLPDLRGWAALRAVVDRGGVSAAAQALSIGQPAVTKRLRALDEAYGLPLTEKVGGRLRLTDAGEKVYLLAVQTLDRQMALRNEIQDIARGKTHLHLEVTFAIGDHFLPKFLLQFAERYPHYKVDSRLAYSRRIHTHLASGLCDLALLERAPDHPDLMIQKWMDDELWLVCGPNHPLFGEEMIPIAMLLDMTYVMRERASSPRRDLEEALGRIGIHDLNIVLEVGSTDTLVDVLMPSMHASFLPRFVVEQEVEAGTLHRIKVHGLRIMRTLWIARHRDTLNNPVADAFIGLIRDWN